MKSPEERYEKRKRVYDRLFQRQTRASDRLSNLRLLTLLAGTAGALYLYTAHLYILVAAVAAATLVFFVYLIVRHDRLLQNGKYTALLSRINDESARRCRGEWIRFSDDGREFADENHPFSSDLDIFGNASLFQWMNTAKTYLGRHRLRELLTRDPSDAAGIAERQKAVDELAGKLRWRQRFHAEALRAAEQMHDPENLIHWVNGSLPLFREKWRILFIRIMPVVTLLLSAAAWLTGRIPYYIPAAALLFQFILLAVKRKDREKVFQLSKKYRNDIAVYYHMIKILEKEKFTAPYLKEVKHSMRNHENKTASRQMDRLSRIVDSLDNRSNAFYFVFNLLTLWDYQNLIALEKWKEGSGPFLKSWLEAIGKTEALASLSILRHDYPSWTMPEISGARESILEAKNMGHPLLTGERVYNHLHFTPPTHTVLITGSNMSGKSTFLRTAGINLVLAYAGAPVCADSFRASRMHLRTCMRVSDNLGKSISSFYAELLRIKRIVEEAAEGKNVFFLLDEIFKGTNSKDRHVGAKVLIRKLCTTNSIGLVSTHDLELCDLEAENRAVWNYHFREYYKDGGIHFDYKLRPGASTTRNAVYLMKLAGIEVEEPEK